jgi:hypothetical protein
MNIRAPLLLLAGCCLLSAGCHRESAVADDSFRMTVERVITDSELIVSMLRIHVPHDASISVDGYGSHSMVVLPAPPAGVARDGQVALSASRVTRPGDGSAYIQTLIRPENSDHGFAGGPAIHPVPEATKLEAYFSISATNGDYKLDTPVEIARLDGKPVMLVVGQPTK